MAGKEALKDHCPECGDKFHCAGKAGEDHCWCADLPLVMPLKSAATPCLCKTCLEKEISKKTLKKKS